MNLCNRYSVTSGFILASDVSCSTTVETMETWGAVRFWVCDVTFAISLEFSTVLFESPWSDWVINKTVLYHYWLKIFITSARSHNCLDISDLLVSQALSSIIGLHIAPSVNVPLQRRLTFPVKVPRYSRQGQETRAVTPRFVSGQK